LSSLATITDATALQDTYFQSGSVRALIDHLAAAPDWKPAYRVALVTLD